MKSRQNLRHISFAKFSSDVHFLLFALSNIRSFEIRVYVHVSSLLHDGLISPLFKLHNCPLTVHRSTGRHTPSYLATITNYVLVSLFGTMKLTSGSKQWFKMGQRTPLDQTTQARSLQSGYSLVHGRLKTSKKRFQPPPPLPHLC